jgi:hypothetical protein
VRQAALSAGVPINAIAVFRRRKIPRIGFAGAQDDNDDELRLNSHALAYFHET